MNIAFTRHVFASVSRHIFFNSMIVSSKFIFRVFFAFRPLFIVGDRQNGIMNAHARAVSRHIRTYGKLYPPNKLLTNLYTESYDLEAKTKTKT